MINNQESEIFVGCLNWPKLEKKLDLNSIKDKNMMQVERNTRIKNIKIGRGQF